MTQIQLRRGTAATWTSSNPILALGEVGIETDTLRFKVGNGTGQWSSLPYYSTAWADVTGKPTVIAAGADQAAARTAIGVAYGTTAGTVVQGNDSRVTGAEQSVNKNTANGYAGLDGNGRLPVSLLPNSVMEYQGTWSPTTNTPTLADGTGSAGDVYRVSVAGSRNLGSGSIAFDVGDYVIYNGSAWQKADTTDAVSTVAGRTGDVTLGIADIAGSTTAEFTLGSLHVGHASDTTISRSSAGVIAVEGVPVALNSTTSTHTAQQLEVGHASDTTISRSSAGVIAVEGFAVPTVSSMDTLTNKTLTNPTVNNYTEGVVALGTVTSSATISLTSGTVITATLTASTACTFTMPTATAGKSFVLLLKQAATTGNGSATFTGVKWNTTSAPTITATAGRMDILSFFADGVNWYGSIVQGFTP